MHCCFEEDERELIRKIITLGGFKMFVWLFQCYLGGGHKWSVTSEFITSVPSRRTSKVSKCFTLRGGAVIKICLSNWGQKLLFPLDVSFSWRNVTFMDSQPDVKCSFGRCLHKFLLIHELSSSSATFPRLISFSLRITILNFSSRSPKWCLVTSNLCSSLFAALGYGFVY